MAPLDLRALPAELQAALEHAWPGSAEAQRRALLGPWCHKLWRTAWPDMQWLWQPSRRWWRTGDAAAWRQAFEGYFGAAQGNILESRVPRLFDPDQPFFPTPWTQARVLLRSPAPEAFSDGEFWALTTQLFDGDPDAASRYALACARHLKAIKATSRARRDRWWNQELILLHASATGNLGGL
jgi:hypothetical protein